MAGLFGWLSGKKNSDNGTSMNGNQSGAFFLDADSAKTFGDIEYMRTAKVVKRTFPKTVSSPEEFERVESVSALDKLAVNGKVPEALQNGSSSNGAVSNGTSANGTSDAVTAERRRSDTSMDMFRSMAKDMRKR